MYSGFVQLTPIACRVAAVAARKADPIGCAQFFGDLRFHFRFHQGRLRFKKQDVGTSLP